MDGLVILACLIVASLVGLRPVVSAQADRKREHPPAVSPDIEQLKRDTLEVVLEMRRLSATMRERDRVEQQRARPAPAPPRVVVQPASPSIVVVPVPAPTAEPVPPKRGGLLDPLFR